jgi:glycosyltransferase involved in cell wall biosynthesis
MVLDKKTPIVCMLSCLHSLQDDRIYWKEALTLKKAGYNVVHIGLGNEKADYYSKEGIRLIQVYHRRYFRHPVADKLFRIITFRRNSTRNIFTAAQSLQATVYHLHDLQLNRIGPQLKRLPWFPKVIYDVHESYKDLFIGHSPWLLQPLFYFYGSYIQHWEIKKARHYDAIIATEEYVWALFSKSLPGKHCEIIYNYSYFAADSLQVAANKKTYDVIYSGTVSRLRGIYELVAATQLVKHRIPGIKILVIGSFNSADLKRKISQQINRLGLQSNLLLHDGVPFEQISAYYRASRIGLCLVHPITLHRNAIFIKAFEYMAFGLPVIASNFGRIQEIVKTTEAGITVDPLQSSAIAGAIIALLTDSALYERCRAKALTSVKETYNWQRQEKKLLDIYKSLLDRP